MYNNNDEKQGRKFFSKIGFAFLGLTLFTIIIQIIIGIILQIVPNNIVNDVNLLTIISSIATYIIPFPLFYYVMNKISKEYKIEKKNMGILKFIACIIVAFSLTYIGNMIGLTITSIIGGYLGSPITNPVSQMIGTNEVWATFIAAVILAPIFEELFFRKLLIDRSIKYGGLASVLISATLFAFYHGNFSQFFYAFLLGAFFSIVYVKTGKIEYTIALHGIVNFFGSVVSVNIASFIENAIPHDISNLTEAQALANPGVLLSFGFSMSILLIILVGILIMILYYKKVDLPKGELAIKKSSIFLNPGMIIFILYYLLMIYLSLFK
ncbi:lysostaphin resistance A-like protein [Methanobrevibacter sp. DSM 116169]|uniref:CPBP family intramembrane glutamic endopeptidase n=1 Tax=Methanobrevibacter sp. DSM 116169 TaxID=3242727 RepID=UPI0038FCF203